MDSLLGAVRAEWELQQRRISILGEIQMLARQLEALGSAEIPTSNAESPARTTRLTSRRPRRSPRRAAIRQHIAAHGPIGRGEINRALGGNVKSLDKHLQRLVRDGEIRVEGQQPHRRYRVSDPTVLQPDGLASARAARPTAVVQCADEEGLLALIAQHGAITTARLRELTGLRDGQIIQWGRTLARRRAITFDGEGPDRTWRPRGERDLASEIYEIVAADPGRFNDHRLALALRAPYERVALACAGLIDRGLTALTDADTYVPGTGDADAIGVAS